MLYTNESLQTYTSRPTEYNFKTYFHIEMIVTVYIKLIFIIVHDIIKWFIV